MELSEVGCFTDAAVRALAEAESSGIFWDVPVVLACSVLGDHVISDTAH